MAGHGSTLPDGVDLLVGPGLDVHAPGRRVQEAHDVLSHPRLDVHHLRAAMAMGEEAFPFSL